MKTLSDEELYPINNAYLFKSWCDEATDEDMKEYRELFIYGTPRIDTLQEQMWLNKKMRSRSGGPVD